ncbi:MAG: hypothetical protein V4773_10195 [Verrucomicrobiota bacterium]
MSPRVPTLYRILAVSTVVGWAWSAQAQTRSPFLPPTASGPAAPTQNASLEFRGFIETSEGMQFRIYNPAKKSGIWVRLNERNDDWNVLVKQHDGGQNTLTVEHGGRTLTLAGREAKVVSAGNAAQAMPPPPPQQAQPSNVAPAVTQTVVVNPTPADEQKRLEAVASEVARRRALREQASQTMSQPAPQQAQPQQPTNARGPQPNQTIRR